PRLPCPLPPFPTRRSSDLTFCATFHHYRPCPTQPSTCEKLPPSWHKSIRRRVNAASPSCARYVTAAVGCSSLASVEAPPTPPMPDRKSTRLNSSHVKISYA